jgi:fructose 1,6-bisphosphatase
VNTFLKRAIGKAIDHIKKLNQTNIEEFLTLPQGFNIDMEMIQNVSQETDEEHSLIWTSFKAAAGK